MCVAAKSTRIFFPDIRFNFDKTGPKRRSPSCPLQTKKKSILDEMTLGYKKFIEETQNLYYALNPESLFDKTLEFRPGTLNDCLQFERAQFVYVLKMLNEHFQPFSDFSDEEKVRAMQDAKLTAEVLQVRRTSN
uniref:NR LBD domain-containing protein n=1 Tax=Bursaphelenchus xylophilus TaxID=6326 RepID=A0A1I7SKF1_BURXY